MTKINQMIVVCGVLLCCLQLHAMADTHTNVLIRLEPSAIASVEFTGESSPVPGHHFTITNRVEIQKLFEQAVALTNADMFITMCGNLTVGEFKSPAGETLAALSINADGTTVVLNGRPYEYGSCVVSSNRPLALFCFELMRMHSLDILKRIRKVGGLCGQSFPFDELDKK